MDIEESSDTDSCRDDRFNVQDLDQRLRRLASLPETVALVQQVRREKASSPGTL